MSGRSTLSAPAVVLISILLIAGSACGISLNADEKETELFRELTVEGSFFPGGDLSLELEYTQQYGVEIEVLCELVARDKSLIDIPPSTPTETPLPEEMATATDVFIPQPQPTTRYKVADLIREHIVANPEGGPVGEATPVPGTLRHSFQAPSYPGPYAIRCLTPVDPNNAIAQNITVSPFPAATPDPGSEEPDA